MKNIHRASALNASPIGTSWHNGVITGTYIDVVNVLGTPDFYNDNSDSKTTVQWDFVYKDGDHKFVFTVYDYGEYDDGPVNYPDDVFNFHIGTSTSEETEFIIDYLNSIIHNSFVDIYKQKFPWDK